MRWLRAWFVVFGAACAFAQNVGRPENPANDVHVVRVLKGYVCGWCGGAGFRTTVTTVEQRRMVEELADAEDPRKTPNRKEKRTITKRQWETLVRSIDAKALLAVPQEQGCRVCVDQPEAWVVIDYSEGSKIALRYGPTNEPVPVKALKFPQVWVAISPP